MYTIFIYLYMPLFIYLYIISMYILHIYIILIFWYCFVYAFLFARGQDGWHGSYLLLGLEAISWSLRSFWCSCRGVSRQSNYPGWGRYLFGITQCSPVKDHIIYIYYEKRQRRLYGEHIHILDFAVSIIFCLEILFGYQLPMSDLIYCYLTSGTRHL